jgi:hypothetical protein
MERSQPRSKHKHKAEQVLTFLFIFHRSFKPVKEEYKLPSSFLLYFQLLALLLLQKIRRFNNFTLTLFPFKYFFKPTSN